MGIVEWVIALIIVCVVCRTVLVMFQDWLLHREIMLRGTQPKPKEINKKGGWMGWETKGR